MNDEAFYSSDDVSAHTNVLILLLTFIIVHAEFLT